MKIIVADFGNYPLYREKNICGNIIRCGIGNLFENMERFKAGVPYDVILVINLANNTEENKEVCNSLQEKYPFIKKVIFRDNSGFDFGAYDAGYQYLKSIDHKGDVLFINSSVRGPSHDYWLVKYLYLFYRENLGLCGISLNSHTTHMLEPVFKPHVQSFFMLTSMKVLKKVFSESLPGCNLVTDDHLRIITEGEIEFSQRILEHGYGICGELFSDFIFYKNNEWKVPFGDPRFGGAYMQCANQI